jgi:hypothetical protein
VLCNTATDLTNLLKIIDNFANINEVKLNVTKTFILIIPAKISRGIFRKFQLDKINKLIFTLAGETVPIVESIRYLGVYLNNKFTNETHLDTKIDELVNKVNKLNLIGFSSPALTPFTKAFLYTTYLRPFLHYGIENYNLNANETKSIKRAESNAFKIALKLSTRIKTTELFLALKILSTKQHIKQLKLAFFIRLTHNSYTRSIIEEILRSGNKNKITNSFINEIFNITRSISLDLKTIEKQCALKLNQYKNKFDHEMKTNVRSNIVKYYLEQLDYHFAITDLLGFHNDSSSAQTCYPLFLIIYTAIQTLFILLLFNTTSISKKR